MAKIIAVVTQKGGVGKTTSAVNLASAIAEAGKRCLLVDIDPQGNATSGVGIDKRQVRLSTYDLLSGSEESAHAALRTAFQNLAVIPSSVALARGGDRDGGHPPAGKPAEGRTGRLSGAIRLHFHRLSARAGAADPQCAGGGRYLLDPGAAGVLRAGGTFPADRYSTAGQAPVQPTLELEGVLFTMYDGRTNLTQQVVAEVKKFFPRKVYGTVIPRSVRLAEAPSYGRPINYYDKNSKGAKAYRALAQEILDKQI